MASSERVQRRDEKHPRLKEICAKLKENETVKVWQGQLSDSTDTEKNIIYGLYRFLLWKTGKTTKDVLTAEELRLPDQLIKEAWKNKSSDDPSIALKAKRDLLAFSKQKNCKTYTHYMKSFYRRNDIPIDLVMAVESPRREEVFPTDTTDSEKIDILEKMNSMTDGYGFDTLVVAAGAPAALKSAIPLRREIRS